MQPDCEVVVKGPSPLLRNATNNDNKLLLEEEGLALLRSAEAPVHIVFAIGGSRCGKSTASNALTFGPDSSSRKCRFETGDTFEPVTTGVDVATRSVPGGGTLVVADCEGAFHACASSQSARGFGALGLLAYSVSSALLHVSMGSIDERDIEALGFLAASAEGIELSPEDKQAEAFAEDSQPLVSLKPPGAQRPALVLLVNGSRFDLGDAVARRLLKVSEGELSADSNKRFSGGSSSSSSRRASRRAIERGFYGQPALEALPSMDHAAYWLKVDALRSRLLDAPPAQVPGGPQASGADVALFMSGLVAALNGEAPNSVGAPHLEPESATEVLYRSQRLEPLVEELSRRFAAEGAAVDQVYSRSSGGVSPRTSPGVASATSVEGILAEFDRRALQLVGGADSQDGAAGVLPVRDGFLLEMRGRLAARLAGITEALARGRQQAADRQAELRQRRRDGSGAMQDSCSSRTSSPGGGASRDGPDGQLSRRGLAALEALLQEADANFREACLLAEQDFADVQASWTEYQQRVQEHKSWHTDADKQIVVDLKRMQDRSAAFLRALASERQCGASAQAGKASNALTELQVEVHRLSESAPDTRRYSQKLNEIRERLEAGKLKRAEACTNGKKAIEAKLRSVQNTLNSEAGKVSLLRDSITRQLAQAIDMLRAELREESALRRERTQGMAEVVERLRISLETHASEVNGSHPRELPSRERLSGQRAQPLVASALGQPSHFGTLPPPREGYSSPPSATAGAARRRLGPGQDATLGPRPTGVPALPSSPVRPINVRPLAG